VKQIDTESVKKIDTEREKNRKRGGRDKKREREKER
jgi:hypothetical protein